MAIRLRVAGKFREGSAGCARDTEGWGCGLFHDSLSSTMSSSGSPPTLDGCNKPGREGSTVRPNFRYKLGAPESLSHLNLAEPSTAALAVCAIGEALKGDARGGPIVISILEQTADVVEELMVRCDCRSSQIYFAELVTRLQLVARIPGCGSMKGRCSWAR